MQFRHRPDPQTGAGQARAGGGVDKTPKDGPHTRGSGLPAGQQVLGKPEPWSWRSQYLPGPPLWDSSKISSLLLPSGPINVETGARRNQLTRSPSHVQSTALQDQALARQPPEWL